MYTVSGSTWQPLSTQTHASNILSNMNAQLQAQSLPIVTATVGNVLWYYCLAAGQLTTKVASSGGRFLAFPSECENYTPFASRIERVEAGLV